MLTQVMLYARMIKFSHTIFALPFALAAVLTIHGRYRGLSLLKTLLIIASFTAMRSFAMAVNRLVDHEIDGHNSRTAMRELPSGMLSRTAVWVFALLSVAILGICAWFLNPLAGYLALPAALVVASYSYAKRFTWACHFWLGAAIGLAPLAVFVALLGGLRSEAVLMSLTLTFYIAGFDILYALQDIDFDRSHGLYSIPARFGAAAAMWTARSSHLVALVFSALLFLDMKIGPIGWGFLPVLAGLLVTEHYLVGSVKSPRYEKIPVAFFNINSAFSIIFLLAILAGLRL